MPAWFAATMQVPMALALTVLPVTLQIAGVVELNVTGRPELAVATSVPVPPKARLGKGPKLIVWLASAAPIGNVSVAGGAAR